MAASPLVPSARELAPHRSCQVVSADTKVGCRIVISRSLGLSYPPLIPVLPSAALRFHREPPRQGHGRSAGRSSYSGTASRVICRASEERYQGLQESIRNTAAKSFAEGLKKGKSDEELIAEQFGVKDPSLMSETQKAYKDKVKESLAKRAAELEKAEAERPGAAEFDAGQKLYGVGRYIEAENMFLAALDKSGPFSKLGGDVQMWLALAYQANGKEKLCIETYKNLENCHPMPAIKKQAYELRYIMEAPKLPLTDEDKVKIPIIENGISPKSGRSYQPPSKPRKKVNKSLEEMWAENYTPPAWVENRYVWAAFAVICSGLAWYSTKL